MTAAVPAAPQPSPTPGIEVTHDPEVPVRFVQIWLCDLCLDGMGGECHTPGCALWINRAPDISLRNSPFVTIMDAAPDAAPEVWSDAVPPGGMVCAMPDDLTADGICGNPVESEPCGRRHEPPATVTPGQADPWAPGDRVTLSLPDKSAPYGRHVLVPGTVRDVDPPGLPTGVRVDLDWTVNGVSWCFATHGELRRLEVSHGR